VSNEVSIMTSARQSVSFSLSNLRALLGSQPHSKQMRPYEREIDRLLNACDDEPPVVRRHVGLLKRRVWWV
jgi:hypothetical protein